MLLEEVQEPSNPAHLAPLVMCVIVLMPEAYMKEMVVFVGGLHEGDDFVCRRLT